MGKLHDSFDSDDSFDESARKQMPPPSGAQPPNTKVMVTATVKRHDSMKRKVNTGVNKPNLGIMQLRLTCLKLRHGNLK